MYSICLPIIIGAVLGLAIPLLVMKMINRWILKE
jgi:hypothetical protein